LLALAVEFCPALCASRRPKNTGPALPARWGDKLTACSGRDTGTNLIPATLRRCFRWRGHSLGVPPTPGLFACWYARRTAPNKHSAQPCEPSTEAGKARRPACHRSSCRRSDHSANLLNASQAEVPCSLCHRRCRRGLWLASSVCGWPMLVCSEMAIVRLAVWLAMHEGEGKGARRVHSPSGCIRFSEPT
jgi:hypothetical protein